MTMQLYRCLVLNNCPHNCCYICIYVTSQDLFMWKKHSKRVSQLPLCVLIIKCLFRLLPKTTHVCNKKREICMLEKRCICITLKVNLSINPSMVGFYHPLFLFLTILTTYGNTEQWTCKPVCSVRTQHTYHWPPRRGRSMVWVKLSSIGDSFKLQAIRVLENARMGQNC